MFSLVALSAMEFLKPFPQTIIISNNNELPFFNAFQVLRKRNLVIALDYSDSDCLVYRKKDANISKYIKEEKNSTFMSTPKRLGAKRLSTSASPSTPSSAKRFMLKSPYKASVQNAEKDELQRLKDTNRKLNILVKYQTESTFVMLSELIVKWTESCKLAFQDLKATMPEDVSMKQLLFHFHADPEKLNYDSESEEFQ